MNFKVGDKVYTDIFGKGVVTDIRAYHDTFPIVVAFETDTEYVFRADGSLWLGCEDYHKLKHDTLLSRALRNV